MKKILSLLAVCITLVSCASYQPPKLPANEYAVLTQSDIHYGAWTFIEYVDGLPPTKSAAIGLTRHTGSLLLAPGRHVLTCGYSKDIGFAGKQFVLLAEAGKTYLLRGKVTGASKVEMWIEDAATGIQVSPSNKENEMNVHRQIPIIIPIPL